MGAIIMDNSNDISIMRAEERGLYRTDHEGSIEAANWLNCELARLLPNIEPHLKKHFAPCEYLTETQEFELCPPLNAYSTQPTLLAAVEELVDELLPWVTALVELRHQLRKV
jgi:hypothetical protein